MFINAGAAAVDIECDAQCFKAIGVAVSVVYERMLKFAKTILNWATDDLLCLIFGVETIFVKGKSCVQLWGMISVRRYGCMVHVRDDSRSKLETKAEV